MNWEAVGAVAELLGALGVIASLIYLATQVRQNSRLLRASAIQSAASNTASGFVSTLAGNLDAAKVVVRGRDRPEALRRMRDALAGFEVGGVPTTLAFHRMLLETDDFVHSRFNTRWLADHDDLMATAGSNIP